MESIAALEQHERETKSYAYRRSALFSILALKGGDVVVDLLAGSGSTMIACERRARKARMLEVNPIPM